LVTFEKFKTTISDSTVTASLSRPKGGPEPARPPPLDPLLLIASVAWSDVILHARLIFFTDHAAAEPLADARGTLGFCETPVENHWRNVTLCSVFQL